MSDTKTVTLYGRVIISGIIEAKTGLHVGKGKEGVAIGGVDNPIMRDTLSNEPYIPGSSLKGKLRSLAEKADSAPQNQPMGGQDVRIHVAGTQAEYDKHWVNPVFGVPGETGGSDKKETISLSGPTRLVARDARLTKESRDKLREADTDLPFTEVKYEAAIDRITAAANPRPLERVPAGSEFDFEMVFSLYRADDVALLQNLVGAMRLLEDDYLGGSGSRGSGKVAFKNLEAQVRSTASYKESAPTIQKIRAKDLAEFLANFSSLEQTINQQITF